MSTVSVVEETLIHVRILIDKAQNNVSLDDDDFNRGLYILKVQQDMLDKEHTGLNSEEKEAFLDMYSTLSLNFMLSRGNYFESVSEIWSDLVDKIQGEINKECTENWTVVCWGCQTHFTHKSCHQHFADWEGWGSDHHQGMEQGYDECYKCCPDY